MKRSIAIIILLAMLVMSLPISVSADDDHYVYGPNALISDGYYKTTGMDSMLVKEGDTVYLHNVAKEGEYANQQLKFTFNNPEFALADYAYVKIGYRTDSASKKIDLSVHSKLGESWHGNGHPDQTNDADWHDIILDMNDLTGGEGLLQKGDSTAILYLKPFGSGNVKVEKEAYYDILYMAFFKTKAEANEYKYDASQDKFTSEDIISAEELAKDPSEEIDVQNSTSYIFGANALLNIGYYGTVGMDHSLEGNEGDQYVHAVVSPGTYNNHKLAISFAPTAFSIADYPYIKIGYRTDSHHNEMNTSAMSIVGESWYGAPGHPDQYCDGQWHDIVLDMNMLTGGEGLLEKGDTTAYLVLKPYNSGTVTIEKSSYFDIKYIACFASKTMADSYTYNPANDDVNMSEILHGDALTEDDGTKLTEYMFEADALIEEIINTSTTVEVTGTKYYISESGNDDNDGLSPATAWKSIAKVNSFAFNPGDGVFFKRGDTFRLDGVALDALSGVTYSAYGEGAKPRFIVSYNASGKYNWIETKYKNIYKYVENIDYDHNVGNIVFDGGDAWGIQIQKTLDGNWHEIGTVYNGLEWSDTPTGAFGGYQDLCYDLQYYHDLETNTLYLYSKDGNPGSRFSSVEIVPRISAIVLKNDDRFNYAHDIIIDNIEVFGAGVHGVSAGSVKDVTVQNCVFKWIGGGIQGIGMFGQNYGVRLGNAVESYGNSENFTIKYCYATQIYDCCWTVQCQETATFKNITMHHNVSEFCNTGLEVWQNDGGFISGLDLHDNYTRFNGYGWSHQRVNKDSNFFYGGSVGLSTTFEKNNIYNNINMLSQKYALKVRTTGPEQYNFHDNVYFMEEGKMLGGIAANPGTGTGINAEVKYDANTIARALSTGFEKGGQFYLVEPKPYGDMFDLYVHEITGIDKFEDISKDFWGREAIKEVVSLGYFNGTSDTTFAPNGTMTRAMLVTVLSRMSDTDASVNTITFADVNKNAWYAPGVAWAQSLNIVNNGTSFRPDENATREELADMLYRYAYNIYLDTSTDGVGEIKDAASVTAEYLNGIKFCIAKGIISGYEDGTVRPKNSATRAEVATMIMRFANYLETAAYDEARVLANTKTVVVSGDELVTILDQRELRKEKQDDGTVKFSPFNASGTPCINILNILNKDINFMDYPYVVIKYKTNIDSIVKSELYTTELTKGGSLIPTGNSSESNSQDIGIMVDMQSYVKTADKNTYDYNLVISVYPWGTSATDLSKEQYFTIEEIIFSNTFLGADKYLGG
ncbi:MAG: S-layer homology domain-containing protein [Clostridia bacterium]|nr:S-layer homology domain-containing protein [Clostridia bacterium]